MYNHFQDSHPKKINLGVGAYRDDKGGYIRTQKST